MTARSLQETRVRLAALGLVLLAACEDPTTVPTECKPLSQELCYDGPAESEGIGACRFGVRTCAASGEGFGECQSQVLPIAEHCGTPIDDDCDGEINEECVCAPGTYQVCYSGPPATFGVGVCAPGTQWCNEDGQGRGPCQGETLPSVELCENRTDDDCDGVINQAAACVCAPGDVEECYTGTSGTDGVGACVAGVRTCLEAGGSFGPCAGEITPDVENCATDEDDDCNGLANEPAASCTCSAGEERSCYLGPAATNGVGLCVAGLQTCGASGDGFGACVGDVVPTSEDCATPEDDDCDGEANEEEEGCECTPGAQELCYTGPPFTLGVGTCKAGSHTCAPNGQWYPCEEEIIPLDDDCLTPLDENCDGAVNEPSSGCFCGLEDPLSLESEDCVLDHGETAWRKPIAALPHELMGDEQGNAYLLMRRELEHVDFEPVPTPMVARALVARHGPNGDLFWGKELTGSVLPETGYAHSYDMSVARDGVVAFTAPTSSNDPSAFGLDSWTWSGAFRLLYSVDPWGYPIFAVSVPRFASEPNTAVHAIAAAEDGGVFYANGPVSSHLLDYDWSGNLAWNVDLSLAIDDPALAATEDGGVLLAFTTDVTVNLGPLPLPPIASSASDLVVVRFDASGDVLWAVRPMPAAAVLSAQYGGGVVGVVTQSSLVRFDGGDGTLLSLDPLPGAMVPSSPFAAVGTDAVVHALNQAPYTDFGLGDLDPYGGQTTGSFIALRGVGATRWARAPFADQVTVGGGPPNIVFAALRATSFIDLNGTLEPLEEPGVFLARLAY